MTKPAEVGISLRPRLHFSSATPEVVEVLQSIPRSRMNATLEALIVKAIVHGLQHQGTGKSNTLTSEVGGDIKPAQTEKPSGRNQSQATSLQHKKATQKNSVKAMLGGKPLSAAFDY
jgi:hypothetical protein